jgi:hypothetical protein
MIFVLRCQQARAQNRTRKVVWPEPNRLREPTPHTDTQTHVRTRCRARTPATLLTSSLNTYPPTHPPTPSRKAFFLATRVDITCVFLWSQSKKQRTRQRTCHGCEGLASQSTTAPASLSGLGDRKPCGSRCSALARARREVRNRRRRHRVRRCVEVRESRSPPVLLLQRCLLAQQP